MKKCILFERRFLFLYVFIFSSLILGAKIKVVSLLGDNMVLQRNSEIKIWGKAVPNQKLNLKIGWIKEKICIAANGKGDWLIKVKTTEAGGPYTVSITSGKEKVLLQNILLGEVWLCSGQSNMEMPIAGFGDSPINGSTDALMSAANSNIRLFTVAKASMAEPQDTCNGSWLVASAESVSKFSAVGYYYARLLQQSLNVPVGMICSSWGGSRIEAWMKNDVITGFADAYKQTTQEKTLGHHRASRLYNGMIAPLVNYNIKGALWYQGESNIGNYQDYAALQAAMIKSWRTDFGVGEFPFYFVQIAPYWYNNSLATNSSLQREAQFNAMTLTPNSGMVTTVDIGEEKNIHPAEKATISKRLALWALSETYNVKGLPYKSPVYKSMQVKDSVAVLTFDNVVNGLTTFAKEVESFEVAGQDSVFYPAKLTISKKQANVYSPKVKVPVAVRYGFRNYVPTSVFLYNTAGLPVVPFRTDNWKK
ncbi:MAG: sialate O-acetylesterase [Paludibacter sp.]|nr:sialate O-acetylesterase [Paludibacter sp.]